MRKINKLKVKKIFFIFICVFLLFIPLFVLLSLKLTNQKSTITNNTISLSSQSTNDSPQPWSPNPAEKIDLKYLVDKDTPTVSNLPQLSDWAESLGVAFSSVEPCSAFWKGSDPSQGGNQTFDWSNVGAATTNQFKNIITFYGKPFKDDQGVEHKSGLENFTTLICLETDIEFGKPEFWLSLNTYMPNLSKIIIKSSSGAGKMTKLPKEIGSNRFKRIEISGQNIGDNYENFLYYNSPLSESLIELKINSCKIKDHLELDSSNPNDKVYYFTDICFQNYGYLKKLQNLDLSNNLLTHVCKNIACLPSIIMMSFKNNTISTWHNIDYEGNELNEGVSQLCFPNPNFINYVDVSGNELLEIVHIKPSEWKPTKIDEYKTFQKNKYPKLKVNITNQHVEKNVFIFGNNSNYLGKTYSDMPIDLSNIYVMPDTITSQYQIISYLSECLLDRKYNGLVYEKGSPTRWVNLTKTQNVMPSIIDLFGDKCNYVNLNPETLTPYEDYKLKDELGQTPTLGTLKTPSGYVVKQVKTYKPSYNNQNPQDACYFTSDTAASFQPNDTPIGAKVMKEAPKQDYEKEIKFDNFAYGISTSFLNAPHTVEINPHYYVDWEESPIVIDSTYTYNIQIFNSEDFVFYLTGIYDNKTGQPIINKYIQSISDSDPSVSDIKSHFFELFSYVGSPDKWEDFKHHFNDEDFVQILSVANDKVKRELKIMISYYAIEFIGNSREAKKDSYMIIIPMSPEHDNRIIRILTAILITESCLVVLLLVPFVYFIIRTKIKTKSIQNEKIETYIKQEEEDIASGKKKAKPLIELSEKDTKEVKVSYGERVRDKLSGGEGAKTKTIEITPKPKKSQKKSIDVDAILEELEKE